MKESSHEDHKKQQKLQSSQYHKLIQTHIDITDQTQKPVTRVNSPYLKFQHSLRLLKHLARPQKHVPHSQPYLRELCNLCSSSLMALAETI